MISPHLPVPPATAQRIMAQLRTLAAGQPRTAAEIAAQMVSMDTATVEQHLKAMETRHLVIREHGGRKAPDKWRLGLAGER